MLPRLTNVPGLFSELSHDVQGRLLMSLAIVLLVWLARRLALRAIEGHEVDPALRYRWRKLSATIGSILSLVFLSIVWIEQFQTITTFLALVGAGLAIALKDLVTGLAGWAFILLKRPFTVGDRIEIAGLKGDVIDQRLFKFSLMEIGNWVDADQSTGRVIHLPNGLALSHIIANYTQGFSNIWNEIAVTVTFESDWRTAKLLMTTIALDATEELVAEAEAEVKRANHPYMLHYSVFTPIVYTSIVPNGVRLTIRHLSPPRRRRTITQTISEAILESFLHQPDIEFAYPTQRFYDRAAERTVPEAE